MINKITEERINKLTSETIHQLLAFQIYRKEITNHLEGCVDIPMFRIRFRFITSDDIRDDLNYEVVLISKLEDVNFDTLFFPMVKKGYLHYLRSKVSNTAFMMFLEQSDLWKRLLQYALDECHNNNPYKYKYLKSLIKKPLYHVLSDNPALFDWILH